MSKNHINVCFCSWPGLTWVNPRDPWPSHFTGSTTGSGLINMIATTIIHLSYDFCQVIYSLFEDIYLIVDSEKTINGHPYMLGSLLMITIQIWWRWRTIPCMFYLMNARGTEFRRYSGLKIDQSCLGNS